MVGRNTKSRATNSIIQSVLDVRSHLKKCLVLQSALSRQSVVNQAMDDSYYWKENEKVQYALANTECQTHIIDGTVQCTNKRGHNIDNKLLFISSYFVYISKNKESKIRSIDKLTKHLTIPKNNKL